MVYLGSSATISMELSVGNSTVGSAVVVCASVVVVAGAAVVAVVVAGAAVVAVVVAGAAVLAVVVGVVVDAVVAASVTGTSGVVVLTSNYH